MKKTITLMLMSIFMIFSFGLFVGCQGAETDKGVEIESGTEGLHYQRISGKEEYQVVGIGTAAELDIVIPSKYNGFPVTKIADSAFKGEKNIESVKIFGNIESVGDWAFANCNSLEKVSFLGETKIIGDGCFSECRSLREVNLPDGLEKLESTVFVDCVSLGEVHIPSSVTEIGSQLFHGCYNLSNIMIPSGIDMIPHGIFYECKKLKNIIIPENIKTIEDWAFAYCENIETINIPQGVSLIEGGCVFHGCKKLETINVSENNLNYKSEQGILYDKNMGVLIYYPINKKDKIYTMPNSIQIIRENALSGNKYLEEIYLSENLIRIEGGAFNGVENITELKIPANVSIIGPAAFLRCTNLKALFFENPEGWGEYDSEESTLCIGGGDLSSPSSAAWRLVECEEYIYGNGPGWWKRK